MTHTVGYPRSRPNDLQLYTRMQNVAVAAYLLKGFNTALLLLQVASECIVLRGGLNGF